MAEEPDLVSVWLDALQAELVAHDGEEWTQGWRLVIKAAGHAGLLVGGMTAQLEQGMDDPAESSRMWLDVIRLVLEGMARGRMEGLGRHADREDG